MKTRVNRLAYENKPCSTVFDRRKVSDRIFYSRRLHSQLPPSRVFLLCAVNRMNAQENHAAVLSRTTDVDHIPTSLPPIVGWYGEPLQSLDQVCSHLSFIENLFDFVAFAREHIEDGHAVLDKDGDGHELMFPLTGDDAGAIILYTCDGIQLFKTLNDDLRTRCDRIKKWYPFIRLFMNGLAKLTMRRNEAPSAALTREMRIVFRGVNKDISQNFKMNSKMRW